MRDRRRTTWRRRARDRPRNAVIAARHGWLCALQRRHPSGLASRTRRRFWPSPSFRSSCCSLVRYAVDWRPRRAASCPTVPIQPEMHPAGGHGCRSFSAPLCRPHCPSSRSRGWCRNWTSVPILTGSCSIAWSGQRPRRTPRSYSTPSVCWAAVSPDCWRHGCLPITPAQW